MTYDPELIERLVKLVHERIARPGCPECGYTGIADDELSDMADQLEAARREIERLVEVHAHAAGVIIDEQLLMRQVVEAAEVVCGPDLTGTERMDLVFDTLMPAIDAYRAAKGKT